MRVSIDLDAYRRNLVKLRQRLAPSELMAVVKDDAYGHGLVSIVPTALEVGITKFAVLDIPTGIRVREICGKHEVQLFAWLFGSTEDFSSAIRAGIDLGVSNVEVLDTVAKNALSQCARVHLKIDSGLHRNGASVDAWPHLVERALYWQGRGNVEVIGVWTHIGEASFEDDARSQLIFDEAYAFAVDAGLDIKQRHLAASAASYERPDFRYDFCRVGGFTYGIAPGDGVGPGDLGLEPAMSAQAFVTEVSTSLDSKTFRIDSGFIDGIPDWVLVDGQKARLPQRGFDVIFQGHRLPIVRVDANSLVIDHSGTELEPIVGDHVTLFGSHLRGEPVLQEWADAIGTVGEEIVVRVGARNKRDYC
jgi:alanine racemase